MTQSTTGQILDGKATAQTIKTELAARVKTLQDKGIQPGLATVLVGDDPGSSAYVAGKHRDCAEVGISSIRRDLPESISQDELIVVIDSLNTDPEVTGYIVQLPLPEQIDTHDILTRIDPEKDADGLHPSNLGSLVANVSGPMSTPLPCTPQGIVELLDRYDISLEHKNVLVIGRGITVGRPLGPLLTRKDINATVTLAHTGTENITEHIKNADVVIAAAGSAHMVQASDLKEGAVVLDVGVSRVVDDSTGKASITGDVDPKAMDVAAWMSPNPGGVGPMTRVMLLKNVVDIAERSMDS